DPNEKPREPDLSKIFPEGAESAEPAEPALPPPPGERRGAPPAPSEVAAGSSDEPVTGTVVLAPAFEGRTPANAGLFIIARRSCVAGAAQARRGAPFERRAAAPLGGARRREAVQRSGRVPAADVRAAQPRRARGARTRPGRRGAAGARGTRARLDGGAALRIRLAVVARDRGARAQLRPAPDQGARRARTRRCDCARARAAPAPGRAAARPARVRGDTPGKER